MECGQMDCDTELEVERYLQKERDIQKEQHRFSMHYQVWGSFLNTLISPTRLANLMAIRNAVFHARQCSRQVALGSKGFKDSLWSTSYRSQLGTGQVSSGYDLSRPLMNCFVSRCVKTE